MSDKVRARRHRVKILDPLERDFARAYRSLIGKLSAQVSRRNPTFNLTHWQGVARRQLIPLYRSSFISAAQDIIAIPALKKKAGTLRFKADKGGVFAVKFGERVDDYIETTYEAMKEILDEAVKDELDGDEIAELVDEEFEDIVGPHAEMLAATEVGAAVNSARDYVMQQVVELGKWITAEDDRVRETHVIYGDTPPKPIGFNYATLTGGTCDLKFPVDPDCDDPAEVVFCRCFLSPMGDVEMDPADIDQFLEEFDMKPDDLTRGWVRVGVDVTKAFNPDQERVPAGSPGGGQFGAGGGDGGERKPHDQAAADVADRALGQTQAQVRAQAMEKGRQRAQQFHDRQRANRQAAKEGKPLPFPGKPKVAKEEPAGKPIPQAPVLKPDADRDDDSKKYGRRSESELKAAALGKVSLLGGGVSGSCKVEIGNGEQAVWKPASGEFTNFREGQMEIGFQTEREVGAWEAAKVFDMRDLGSPTVQREMTGKESLSHHRAPGGRFSPNGKGALMAMQPGKEAGRLDGDKKYDGERDLMRAAMFDYVTGNTDRHDGNWMVDGGRIRLIDHGYSFPDNERYHGNSWLVERAVRGISGASDEQDYGTGGKHKVDDFLSAFRGKDNDLREALKRAGVPAAGIVNASRRLGTLSSAKTWRDVRYILSQRQQRIAQFREEQRARRIGGGSRRRGLGFGEYLYTGSGR